MRSTGELRTHGVRRVAADGSEAGRACSTPGNWGPGKHSIRRMTDGSGGGRRGPWREVQVFYLAPRSQAGPGAGGEPFSQEAYRRARSRSTGRTQKATSTSTRPADFRKMGLRWAFDGPRQVPRYAAGSEPDPADSSPSSSFDQIRSKPPAKNTAPPPHRRGGRSRRNA